MLKRVELIPMGSSRRNGRVQDLLVEVEKMGCRYIQVDTTSWKTVGACKASFKRAIETTGRNWTVHHRDREIYIDTKR